MATRPRTRLDTPKPPSRTGQAGPRVQKQPDDRRVRRTQRQLREALVSLILERGWDAVTVRDVTERADVGRSTFYVHYADKEALLVSGFDELHAEMAALGRDAKVPFAFAEPLLSHAVENERVFKAVVGRQSGQQVQWRFREVVVTALTHELSVLKVPAAVRATTAHFLAGGFLELLAELLESPSPARAQSIAATFRRLALGVLRT